MKRFILILIMVTIVYSAFYLISGKSSWVSKYNYYDERSWYSVFNILPGCINIVFIGGLVFLIDSKY